MRISNYYYPGDYRSVDEVSCTWNSSGGAWNLRISHFPWP